MKKIILTTLTALVLLTSSSSAQTTVSKTIFDKVIMGWSQSIKLTQTIDITDGITDTVTFISYSNVEYQYIEDTGILFIVDVEGFIKRLSSAVDLCSDNVNYSDKNEFSEIATSDSNEYIFLYDIYGKHTYISKKQAKKLIKSLNKITIK